MSDAIREMALIRILDPNAKIMFSDYTNDFYVSCRIEITNGEILSTASGRGNTPEEAVANMIDRICVHGIRLVTNAYTSERREWTWYDVAESWGPYYG